MNEGDELMIPRVPRLPPELSARHIAEHEVTGHAIQISWCCQYVGSKGRLADTGVDYGCCGRDKGETLPILCCINCRSSTTRCLGATVVDKKDASDHATSFLTTLTRTVRVQEQVGEIRQRTFVGALA